MICPEVHLLCQLFNLLRALSVPNLKEICTDGLINYSVEPWKLLQKFYQYESVRAKLRKVQHSGEIIVICPCFA
jgi:hypothetical protein